MTTAERTSSGKETPEVVVARLAAGQQGVVHRHQLLQAGLTNQQIHRRARSGLLVPTLPAVYRHGSVPDSWMQQLWAAQLWAGQTSVLSHESAGALWGLDGCPAGRVVVLTTRSLKSCKEGVTVHRVTNLPSHHITVREGLRVTTPARTLLDLAAVLSEAALEEALDCALRRGSTSLRRLEAEMGSHIGFGRRGRATLKRLMRERSPDYAPTHSVLETRFRRLLKRHGFPPPGQQHVVHRLNGAFAFVDFIYPHLGLVIEVDGFDFHSGRGNWQSDLSRQNDLVVGGARVLRFTWRDLHDREAVVVRTLRAVFAPELPLSGSERPKTA